MREHEKVGEEEQDEGDIDLEEVKLDKDLIRAISSSHNILLNLHTASEVLVQGEDDVFNDTLTGIFQERENMYYCILHIMETKNVEIKRA